MPPRVDSLHSRINAACRIVLSTECRFAKFGLSDSIGEPRHRFMRDMRVSKKRGAPIGIKGNAALRKIGRRPIGSPGSLSSVMQDQEEVPMTRMKELKEKGRSPAPVQWTHEAYAFDTNEMKFGGKHNAQCVCPVCHQLRGEHYSHCVCPHCQKLGGDHFSHCTCLICGRLGGKHYAHCICPKCNKRG